MYMYVCTYIQSHTYTYLPMYIHMYDLSLLVFLCMYIDIYVCEATRQT